MTLLLLSLLLPGRADPDAGLSPEAAGGVAAPRMHAGTAVQLWSRTAVEGLPDLSGDPALRLSERLGLDVRTDTGWKGSVRGGLRRTGDARWVGDLWRGSLSYTGRDHGVVLGRHVRLDARGFQRLDGISAHLDDGGPVGWRVWLGRRWHPEVVLAQDAWVGGTETRLSAGEGASAPQLRLGFEGRQVGSSFALRTWGQASVRSVYGRRATVMVESDDKARVRASLDGSLPVGRFVDLGAQARWEDLAPSTALDQPRAPLLWLAPEGYGVGSVRLAWSRGGWGVVASGGPTVRPGPELLGGGLGRASVSRRLGAGEVALFGLAAGIGRTRLAGGGLGVDLGGQQASLRVQGAGWHLRPLDQDPGFIAEVRGIGRADVVRLGGANGLVLGLAGQVSTGADRQLQPFVRGGVAVTGRWSQEALP